MAGREVTDRGFDLRARLDERAEQGLHRSLEPAASAAPRTRLGGEEQTVFASNNYLGLATDDRVQAAAAAAAHQTGAGAGASRLVTGDTDCHHRLEEALVAHRAADRALVFSSGYAANVGTLTALAPDVVFSDELNHASIIDGCRLADAETVVYDHCDPDALATAMRERARTQAQTDEAWLVVTDSVFSMDGDVAPLRELCDVVDRHGAWLMVDEAHATGLYADGGGIIDREGLGDRVDVQLGTLSKALASQGGYIAGSETLIEYLVNAARSFVFSTGLAPPAAGAAREALRIAREGDHRDRLWENVATLRSGLTGMGYEVRGETQILPVIVGDREVAVTMADRLAEHGIVAPAIRPPTVPGGTSRLRVAPTAAHTGEELADCLAAFETVGQELNLI